ncbi:MAG: dicarboxylate/amino acid:cation symporter [Coriobacteriales bacterium]|nr:dicarboxylate/amino acid:cation symporter [Coriobacteriales bacterium]
MVDTFKISCKEQLPELDKFIQKKLRGFSIPRSQFSYICKLVDTLIERANVICKNAMEIFSGEETNQDIEFGVEVRTRLGEKSIRINAPCLLPEKFNLYCDENSKKDIVLNSKSLISIVNKDGSGQLIITVKASSSFVFIKSLVIIIAALLIGNLGRLILPPDLAGAFTDSFTGPLVQLFLDAVTLIATPVTFFAIISTSAFFYTFLREKESGRTLLVRYLLSAAIAVIVGSFLFFISPHLVEFNSLSSDCYADPAISENIPDFFASLIPKNIIDPFTNGNAIQLLVLAIIIGVAVGALRATQPFVGKLIDAINSIFIYILGMIFRLAPYVLFFSVFNITLSIGTEYVLMLLLVFVFMVLGIIVIMLMRLVILAFRGVNIKWFLKKYKPFIKPVFLTGSTIDAIPYNINTAQKEFGLDKEYLNTTITFCAHNNMDGNCLFLAIVCQVLFYIAGIELDVGVMFLLIFFAILLSAGAPNQPGSGIICMAVILPLMGLSNVIMLPIIFLDLIIENLIAAGNNFCDIATVVTLAKKEGKL